MQTTASSHPRPADAMSASRAARPASDVPVWDRGDFTRIAATMRRSGEALVRSLCITPGLRVLDLGCGDGTTALPAAQLGASVLGIDIAAGLVAAGNRRAADAGLADCRFRRGDASDLGTLPDRSFDRVLSFFGAMFADRPFDVAREMVRVTRPGGRIVMGNWMPDAEAPVPGMLAIGPACLPAAPAAFVSPLRWGVERDVLERFRAAGVAPDDIACVPDTYTFRFAGTPAQFVDAFRRYDGPTMLAFEAAQASGHADALRRQLEASFERRNTSTDRRTTTIAAPYLRVKVRVR